MKKIFIVVLLVLLGGGSWYAYQHKNTKSEQTPDDFVLSASMSCEDGYHFIAEFVELEKVNIIVDGNTALTLPKVEGLGQRYENDAYIYTFAGEEATITTKATSKTVSCTQPFDPNNAPVNFGDAGEGGGAQQDTSLIVSESIIGKWQSIDDVKFTREFKTGGTSVDMYDTKITSNDTWKVFTKENPLQVSFPIETGVTYIQIMTSGQTTETLNFKLVKLTPEELELIYMDRGGTLRFTRVGSMTIGNGKYCFAYIQQATTTEPYNVEEHVVLNINGNKVTGTKTGTQSGPDMTNGYDGTISGTFSGNMLDVIFTYTVEGSTNKEQEIYELKSDSLIKSRYSLTSNKDILIPDKTSTLRLITYTKEVCPT